MLSYLRPSSVMEISKIVAGVLLLSLAADAQMVSPTIDGKDQPFSYFSKPTDIVGVMNAPSATEISPEGFLYTGFGELMFFLGPEQTPLSARIRTLEDGYLPVISYSETHQGVAYDFTVFAAQIPAMPASETEPTGQIANFVRVTLRNLGDRPQAAFLTSAIRYEAEQTTGQPQSDNRFRRPVPQDKVGNYQQPGEPFNANWTYRMEDGTCQRENRILYTFPQQPAPRLALTLRTHYNRILPVTETKLDLTPTTPACSVAYSIPLAAHESRILELRMPLLPVERNSVQAQALRSADFDRSHAEVAAFWKKLVARGMQIDVPESKPVDTFRASLVYDLLARNIVQGQYVQTASQFQYHRFYLRDGADYVRMYDATGYQDIGSEDIAFFATRQQARRQLPVAGGPVRRLGRVPLGLRRPLPPHPRHGLRRGDLPPRRPRHRLARGRPRQGSPPRHADERRARQRVRLRTLDRVQLPRARRAAVRHRPRQRARSSRRRRPLPAHLRRLPRHLPRAARRGLEVAERHPASLAGRRCLEGN
jgi:hypothetical protein